MANVRSVQELAFETFVPIVTVAASPDAEEICRRNNLSLVDLLTPFARLKTRVNMRDPHGQPYSVDQFQLKFEDMKDLERSADSPSASKYLSTVVGNAAKEDFVPPVSDQKSLTEHLAYSIHQASPWYSEYRDAFMKTFLPSDHEFFHHPVACLIAISSANPDPVNTFQRLYQTQAPPPIMNKGFMDPYVLKYYVVLHDASANRMEDADAIFQKLKTIFGMHSRLIVLNSLKYPNSEAPPLWSYLDAQQDLDAPPVTSPAGGGSEAFHPLEEHPNQPESKKLRGHFLSSKDLEGLSAFVREFATQSIIPYMEKNIVTWNETVASSRRGFTGKLFSAKKYFSSGSKPAAATPTASGTLYHYSSPEAQLRKLADYSFLLQNYRFASEIYDTAKKDFANDKALKHLAGTSEMMAICQMILNENIREVEPNYDGAVANYLQKCKLPSYATRATMFFYEFLKLKGYYKDATIPLIRISTEDSDLRSALTLEQAAHTFIRAKPPMIRKFSFHLVLAGYRYSRCGQRQHAYRCYTNAMKIYENKDWAFIEDHIQFLLARQASQLNLMDKALEYFVSILQDSQQNSQQQADYLREFLYVYKNYAADHEGYTLELGIPKIEDKSIKLIPKSQRNMVDTHTEEEWVTLERGLVHKDRAPRGGKHKKNIPERPSCVVGEPLLVRLELQNPLQIPIQLNEVVLQCTYNPHEVIVGRDPLTDEERVTIKETSAPQLSPGPDIVHVEKISQINMNASEKLSFEFEIIPKKEGSLQIQGLSYLLNGTIKSVKTFKKKGLSGSNPQMDLIITSPMPRLEVTLSSFPENLLSGEVKRTYVTFTNHGERSLINLRTKVSHPSFFAFGRPEELNLGIYAEGVVEGVPAYGKEEMSNALFAPDLIALPLPEQSLAPGHSFKIPLWVRGDRVGAFNFQFVFAYESETKNPVIKTRLLRHEVKSTVSPSIRISAVTRQSAKALNQYILSVEVENMLANSIFEFRQISSASPAWKIEALSFEPTQDSISRGWPCAEVGPKETMCFYFRLSRLSSFHFDPIHSADVASSQAVTQFIKGETVSVKMPDAVITFADLPCVGSDQKSKHRINSSSGPLKGLLRQSHGYSKQLKLASLYPEISPPILSSLFSLYTSNDVNLTLFWACKSFNPHATHEKQKVALGHHYFLNVHLGNFEPPIDPVYQRRPSTAPSPSGAAAAATSSSSSTSLPDGSQDLPEMPRSLFTSTEKEKLVTINSLSKVHSPSGKAESPLKHVILAPDVVYFDFENEKANCELEVKVQIHNSSSQKRIDFVVEFMPPAEPAQAAKDQKDSTANASTTTLNSSASGASKNPIFSWVGATKQFGSLRPEEKTELVCYASFPGPGVYELSKVRIRITNPSDLVHFSPNIQYLVSVLSSSKN